MILFYFRFDHIELSSPLRLLPLIPTWTTFWTSITSNYPSHPNLKLLMDDFAEISLYFRMVTTLFYTDQEQCVVHWACRNSSFRLGNIANACLKYIAVSSINEGIKPPFNKIQTMFAQKNSTMTSQY